MVKTKNRPDRSKREKVQGRVNDLIATTRKWLFPEAASLKYVREVAQRLPRHRQLHFVAKFSYMDRLRSFCHLADNARATRVSLADDIFKQAFDDMGSLKESVDVHFCFYQRLPELRRELSRRKVAGGLSDSNVFPFPPSASVDLRAEYFRLVLTGKCRNKSCMQEVELLMRKVPALHIPNSFNTDMKILFDTGKIYDAIIIPSDAVGTMVIPLSIHPDEIETLSSISFRKNVHRLLLSARSPFFAKLFQRRNDPNGHISLIVLDSSIIPGHLLKVVLAFIYTNELSALETDSPQKPCDLASDSELYDLPLILRRAVALYGVGKILQMTSLIQASEDKIVDALSCATVLPVLQWAERDHGSSYVSRKCMTFVRENFLHLSNTGVLTGLTTEEMIQLLQDDYLQSHELDVLRSALRWAEHSAREKEPDIIKKRKKDPSNDLVRNALAPLLPYIRLEYILPANCPDLAKVFQSGLIRNPPTGIDGSTTIGRGWDYGDSRSPRFFRPIVDVFLDLNNNEWIEESFTGSETVPRSASHLSYPPEILINSIADEIEQNLVIPQEEITCQVLKRLHSLQQKHQPHIPRHMHFLRLTVLREFSLPDGLIPVLRDPCQYYPGSKSIKHNYALVQRYRYYKKLNDNCSSPTSPCCQPDVTVFPFSPPTSSPQKYSSTLVRLMQSPVRKIRQNFRSMTMQEKSDNQTSFIDYIPSKNGKLPTTVRLPFASCGLPDIATTSQGIENLTYRTSSSNSS